MAGSLKARESRLRRAAARRGMALAKSRRGGASNGYRIVDPQTDAIVHDGDAGEYSLTLDQAEAFLGDPQQTGSISIDNLNAANDE
jgi:hypothetical protein